MIHSGRLAQNKLVFLHNFLWTGENIHSAKSGWGFLTTVAEAAIIFMMGFYDGLQHCSVFCSTGWHTVHTTYPYMA